MLNFDDDRYFERRENWMHVKSEKLLEAVRQQFKFTSFSINDFAVSIARSYHLNEEFLDFFDAYSLDDSDAVCFLHYMTDKYEDELDKAYQDYLDDFRCDY